MHIPHKFQQKLKLDQELEGIVSSTSAIYSKLLKKDNLEFFPDYTDHGISHVESVLRTAEFLITDETFDSLIPLDVCVLILSIVLHDLGMHITKDGFKRLINGDSDDIRLEHFDKFIWKDEWTKFLHKAKRFNQQRLVEIFGDKDVLIVEPEWKNMSDVDKKLIGEFLRLKHARLAHEIAIKGFPSAEGEYIGFGGTLGKEKRDLCGLIARSHGLPLRNTFDYLQLLYQSSWRRPYNVKAVFLMGVLRIADYLQIHQDRAPNILLKTKTLSSPISKQEWEKNNSVEFIDPTMPDPELINIHAKPKTSEIYLELEKLFKDIQLELDTTWAVLGEVYGNDKLKIKYRRIKSNIDDKSVFAKTIKYVPEKIFFNADPEILKLLVGPLYGENPTYGIRELLQNSTDACNELEYLLKRKFGEASSQFQNYKPIVSIKFTEYSSDMFLEIKDNGIGMDVNTIVNYFFKAGASFRYSEGWKDIYQEGKDVKIIRSGRFGVGVLATFLIGNEIEVCTKHFDSADGYKFKAKLDSSQVELIKSDCENGTYIKIKLSKKNRDYILGAQAKTIGWFAWYHFNKPKLIFDIDEKNTDKFHFKNNDIAYEDLFLEKGWRKLEFRGYDDIYYTFKDDYYSTTGEVYCNGFKIPNGYVLAFNKNKNEFYKNEEFTDFPFDFRLENENTMSVKPVVSIIDKSAKLPLKLNRDSLENNVLPFSNDLTNEVCKELLARLLTLKFFKYGNYYLCDSSNSSLKFLVRPDYSNDITYLKDGYFLNTDFINKTLKTPNKLSLFYLERPNSIEDAFTQFSYFVNINKSESIRTYQNRFDDYFGRRFLNWVRISRAFGERRIFLKKEKYEYLFSEKTKRLSNSTRGTYSCINENNKWVELIGKYNKEKNKPSLLNLNDFDKFDDKLCMVTETCFSEEKFDSINSHNKLGIIEKFIVKYLGDNMVIPFELEDRKRIFKKLFLDLEKYIKIYN